MATLYLTEQGSVLKKTYKRLVVEKDGQVLLEVPSFKIDRVLVYGNVQLTTQAMAHLLDTGIEVSLLSSYGKFRGRLAPAESKNVYLRMSQYKRSFDEGFKVSLAKTIVSAKTKNARALVRRYTRNHPEVDFNATISELSKSLETLRRKEKVATILGVEGQSAAIYFEAYGRMFTKELQFEARSRRPPRDPVNALLSFGYVLITNEIFSVVSALGFDPYIGYLHGINYGRPSLALDIAEEFRHPIVDMLTLDLINRHILREADFKRNEEDGSFRLKEDALRTYFVHYEKRMLKKFKEPETNSLTSFRELFKRQAHRLAKAIQEDKSYRPFRI